LKNYREAKNKRTLQKEIYKYFIERGCDKVVGLAGPDIVDYERYLKGNGFRKIRLFENSVKVLKKISSDLCMLSRRTEFRFGDVYDVKIRKGYFYDLDFCCTMRSIEKYVKKFRDNFSITVSLRGCGLRDTISLFAQYREENVWLIVENTDNKQIVQTDKGTYVFCKYSDTSAMCIIYKLKE